jgi:hypothetical protein
VCVCTHTKSVRDGRGVAGIESEAKKTIQEERGRRRRGGRYNTSRHKNKPRLLL